MKSLRITLSILVAALAALATPLAAKPLKVYILCGQSNMEGHAQTRTFPAIATDPKTAGMHKLMVDADGKPVVCDDVWIAYSFGNFSGDPVGKRSGKLTAGFGSQHHIGTGISNQGFHYYGSAKFFGLIGKAFADALVGLK